MEGASSSGGNNHQPRLPPGFRFHPTDEELVVHYLKKKAASAPLPVAIIAEIDLYKFDPWELPSKASFGEEEWYFFSPRERKYPNGERPNRAATSGYWKATGTDKPVMTANGTQKIGVKKALVFYGGKPPKGVKTNWIMHEYRLITNTNTNKPPGINLARKTSSRLDDWVLCRIFKKNSSISSSTSMETSLRFGQIPRPGPEDVDRDYFTAAIPMSISPNLDGMMATNGAMFSGGKEWGTDEENYNPSSNNNNTSSSSNDKNNISFISLLNQQYSQTFHQNNPQEESGSIMHHQSYQIPDSHFQNFN